jgi:hypothetical protein
LIVCRNPLLAAERARKRRKWLAVAEKKLEAVKLAVSGSENPLRGKDNIGLRVGRDFENLQDDETF